MAMMVAEGFPERTIRGFGPAIRKLGYGRGWGRPWSAEEDALLSRAYAQGLSLTRSEEHTSELQSLMRISYAVFCLKKKKQNTKEDLIQNKYQNLQSDKRRNTHKT